MRRKLIPMACLTFVINACASPQNRKASADVGAATPLYSEKVGAVLVEKVRAGSCPKTSWESVDWRKLVSYANACVKNGDWAQVEKMGNHLAIVSSDTPWGAYYLSLSAANQKNFPRAIWMLELALKKAPREGILHYQMGRLLWETGDEAGALKSLKTASEENADLTEAHSLMGTLAFHRQDFSSAEKYFQKALERDSGHWLSLMGMASVRVKENNWKEAENFLQKCVRANPLSSRVRVALAQIQEQHLKKLAEALEVYKDLKSLSSENKLDEILRFNVDEKINNLEQTLSQAQKVNQVTVRQPADEKKVSK